MFCVAVSVSLLLWFSEPVAEVTSCRACARGGVIIRNHFGSSPKGLFAAAVSIHQQSAPSSSSSSRVLRRCVETVVSRPVKKII